MFDSDNRTSNPEKSLKKRIKLFKAAARQGGAKIDSPSKEQIKSGPVGSKTWGFKPKSPEDLRTFQNIYEMNYWMKQAAKYSEKARNELRDSALNAGYSGVLDDEYFDKHTLTHVKIARKLPPLSNSQVLPNSLQNPPRPGGELYCVLE